MKTIFLDIDGVLNVEVYVNAVFHLQKQGHLNKPLNSCIHDQFGIQFCPTAVNMIEYIIKQTDAKIVISSTWRHSGLKVMQQMWKARNLPGEVIGITPHFKEATDKNLPFKERAERGLEVQDYCLKNNITNYVIFDDDNDFLPEQESRFIQTDAFYGITSNDATKAIQILNSNPANVASATLNHQ